MKDRKQRGHLEEILKPLPPLCWLFYANLDVHTAKVSKLTPPSLYIQMIPSQVLKFRETKVNITELKILLFACVVIPLCSIKFAEMNGAIQSNRSWRKKYFIFVSFCKTSKFLQVLMSSPYGPTVSWITVFPFWKKTIMYKYLFKFLSKVHANAMPNASCHDYIC